MENINIEFEIVIVFYHGLGVRYFYRSVSLKLQYKT